MFSTIARSNNSGVAFLLSLVALVATLAVGAADMGTRAPREVHQTFRMATPSEGTTARIASRDSLVVVVDG